MAYVFWIAFAGVWYAYFGYPIVLLVWRRLRPRPVRSDPSSRPSVSIVLPVHNEAAHLAERLRDLTTLRYPRDMLEMIVVSDGSDDGSDDIVLEAAERDARIRLERVPERGGKGNALNLGIASAQHEIILFIDAGLRLEPDALIAIVGPFADADVSCVSGEDRISGMSGEGLYGRYELFLRRCESDVSSLVGVSGSFYAQRRAHCPTFRSGLAPDFVAALHAVSLGRRAVAEASAVGWMDAVSSYGKEFSRKTRTVLRGMTALVAYAYLLNPWRAGGFSIVLGSHKVMRWLVPWFLLAMLLANLALVRQPLFAVIGAAQGAFYGLGLLSLTGVGRSLGVGRVAAYFLNVNAAIAVAWLQFLRGRRQEVWAPTRR